MPEPGENESQDEFIERCIPVVLEDGTASDSDQAVAICNSMWREAKKSTLVTIKAVGDWELDVLGVPYGGPIDGKDAQKEYFSPRSNLHLDRYKDPLVHYYHGLDPSGRPEGEPEVIGRVQSIESREDGVWYRVILDKASSYAKRIIEAARRGIAVASSGTIEHLRRVSDNGHIDNWPVAELSLFDATEGRRPANTFAVALPVMKARYKQAGETLPDLPPETNKPKTEDKDGQENRSSNVALVNKTVKETSNLQGDIEMDEKEVQKAIAAALKADREASKAAAEAAAKAAEEQQEAIDAAVEAATKEQEKKHEEELAAANRPPGGFDAPYVAKHGDLWKYDDLDPGDQAFLVGVLDQGKKSNVSSGPSETAVKALGVKLAEAAEGIGIDPDDESARRVGIMGCKALYKAGYPKAIKANEIMQQALTSYGEEWVGVAYSQALWESIRQGTFVAQKLPSVEVPQGFESIYLPIESTDPTFYMVAEATGTDTANIAIPVSTVTSSQMTTGRVLLTLSKMGCRVLWSGELEEDSLIPFVSQLRTQITTAGAETLEHVIIDGDTAAGGTANINDIAGTPGASDVYLMFGGFRKSPLVTTTANSRDGGVLTDSDYLETLKLMGAGGLNSMDVTKVDFIQDLNVRWKSLELAQVKTRDVFSNPTIENGQLVNIWGYNVHTSAQMHRVNANRKTEASGKIDVDTPTDNTKGALLAVRWDQWKLGWRRRMTLETTRYARADTTEITALMRVGLIQRDTEASAISYNITV